MTNKTNNDEIEIDLLKLLRTLWNNALVILLAGLVAGLVAFFATSLLMKPKYQANTMICVNNSSYSYGKTNYSISSSEVSASNSLVQTYVAILKSRTTLEAVIQKAGVNYTYQSLSSAISTEVVSGTATFNVTVTTNDPSTSELIANTIAEVLPDRIAELVDGASAKIVDYAITPSHRSSPSYKKNIVIGIAGGVLCACVVIVLLSLKKTKENQLISSSDDLEKMFPDYQLLAVIPDMRHAGKKGYYYSSYYGTSEKGKK